MDIPPLVRQVMVATSPILAAFSVGGAVTYPSLLMEQFRSNNSSVDLDLNTRSWIGSIYGLAGIPVILMPVLAQKFGRKYAYIMSCLYVLIGWILTYIATTTTEILISESFHGLGVNSLLPISFLGMSEMLAPKNRFIFMQAFGVAQCSGMASSGILGRFFHFKTVSIIMFVPIVLALAIALLWPESPSWFASKGKFDKCKKAFIELRGSNGTSELMDLITAQRENLSMKVRKQSFKGLFSKFTRRDFYMPTLHIFVLMHMLYWSGGDVLLIYFMEMATKSTSNVNATFYAAIVMYVIIVLGMIITNLLIIRINNKTVLLISTSSVTFFLACTSLVTGFQTLGIVSMDSLLSVYCILLVITSGSLGLASLVFVIAAELMPVKHRSLGGALYIIFNCLLYTYSQKLSPYLFVYINLWGTFLVYTVNAFLCALFVWKFVPETTGRSLQEIEDYYMFGRFIERRSDESDNQIVCDHDRT